MRRVVLSFCAACLLFGLVAQLSAADGKLQAGDHVAVIGDSITEQKLYSLYIEDYLLMCQPAGKLQASQYGWGGETAPGFLNRMANDCLRFKPTVATTCYGMNDGGYSPLDDAKAKRYRDAQKAIVQQMKANGVRFIVVGSPGAVDVDKFRNDPKAAEMYNKTLAGLRDIARSVAQEEGVGFANVHDAMIDAMTKAKAKYGKDYHVGGGDGVHPERNGQLVMAYAFLKALGCDGNIGTITVDLAAGKADATEGHNVNWAGGGNVELESTRYPFCFTGDAASPSATRGIIEFMPFNDELNRYVLVVKNPGAEKVKVTWGKGSKVFSAADLAKGVNLAAEFLDNPFSEPFAKAEKVIAFQQGVETPLVKTLLHTLPEYGKFLPDEREALECIAAGLVKKDTELRAAACAAVQPVKHTLKLEAMK